jgi:hypothetical protein
MGLYVKKPTTSSMVLKGVVGAVWALAIGGSLATSMRYESTPGAAEKPGRAAGKVYEIVMVVHPDCPCTGASVSALRKLLGSASVPVKAHLRVVAFAKPDHPVGEEKYARALPNADAAWISPEEAKAKYGALTSGHVAAFFNGNPVFSGGLTSGRGVESLSESQLRLRDFLSGKPINAVRPVFGCALNGEKL